MKVAVVISDVTIRGGTHKQVLRLCQYLKKQKVNCTIYTKFLNLKNTYPEFQDIPIVSCYADGIAPDKHGLRLTRMLAGFHDDVALLRSIPDDMDIINIHDSFSPYFMLSILRKNAKIEWQINDMPACFCVGVHENDKDTFWRRFKRLIYRYVAKKIDAITVNVSKNCERVKKCMGVDARVFYCGVDENPDLHTHEAIADHQNVKLLSSGVFFPYRNYETQVAVVEKLKQDGRNVHLNIIGSTETSPDYSQKIQELIKLKCLENYIHIWGQVDEQTYANLHNGADMFLFINVNQSWGIAVFEAMSCGLPVIVSESVGAVELLHDDSDAVIVDPTDVDVICNKIKRLIDDPQYYRTITIGASIAVKKYLGDKPYCERMLSLFCEILHSV